MKQYVVDAFTNEVFGGNPAAVCILKEWLPEDIMQKIAIENNLSETAFVVKNGEYYNLRWFTPKKEIDLCGHATLATAYVIAHFYEPNEIEFIFKTISGELIVNRNKDLFEMDFPSRMPKKIEPTKEMIEVLGQIPKESFLSRDLMFVLDNEEDVANFNPDYSKMSKLPEGTGFLITASSKKYDFVSRCFFPKLNVNEDPVCGSAHCNFIPYWADKLSKKEMIACELSQRGGIVYCNMNGSRVTISGNAVLYSKSDIYID